MNDLLGRTWLAAAMQRLMTFSEDNPQIVFDLLRWLGPGAELMVPQAWRQ